MQIILLSKKGRKTVNLSVTRKHIVMAGLSVISIILIAAYLVITPAQLSYDIQPIENKLSEQRTELEQLKSKMRNTLDGLALRVGQIQTKLMHLNAVGEHLAKKARLKSSEFDFDAEPAQGGAESAEIIDGLTESQLMRDIQKLDEQMSVREKQLQLLDQFMLNKTLAKKVRPAGLPVEKGWLSSYYGYRIDPFNGRKAFHHGVDVAGKNGSNVLAVASGIVSWVGDKGGYGMLVEIDHGDGFVTRYGHNKSLTVAVGDAVIQGQVIAKMGSTGRSTGPHVHFEVIKNGKKVNPKKYLWASR
jgi:murein DD-endopeptidase MepM/ murein hydrolase activator NlpD